MTVGAEDVGKGGGRVLFSRKLVSGYYLLVAYILLLVGGSGAFPLVEYGVEVVGTNVERQRWMLPHEFGQVVNVVMLLAAMGGAFWWTRLSRGVVAVGVGMVGYLALLPVQILSNPWAQIPVQGGERVARVQFGWWAWLALLGGGLLLAVLGVAMRKGEAGSRNAGVKGE